MKNHHLPEVLLISEAFPVHSTASRVIAAVAAVIPFTRATPKAGNAGWELGSFPICNDR